MSKVNGGLEKFWVELIEKNTHFKVNSKNSKLIQDGFNKIFLIQTEDIKFILRASRIEKGIPLEKEDYYFEFEVLLYLKQNGFPVAVPLKWNNGSYLIETSENNTIFYCCLIKYVEGKPYFPFDEEKQFIVGKFLAKMHNSLLNFSSNYKRINWDIKNAVIRPIDEFNLYLGKTYLKESKQLLKIKDWLIEKLSVYDEINLPFGLVHGDMHNLNIHFLDDNRFFIFDFDFLAQSYLVFDISAYIGTEQLFLSVFEENDNFPDNYTKFLEGYVSIRELKKEEIDILPLLEIMRWLIVIGGYVHMIKNRGRQIKNDHTLEDSLRSNMMYMLFRIEDLISKVDLNKDFDYISYTRYYKKADINNFLKKLKINAI